MNSHPSDLAPGVQETAIGARIRVLVVDDEVALTQVIEYALAARSEVLITHSGLEAKQLLNQDSRFDMIFCDLMMPDMNGMALHAYLLQENPSLADRMVFMSGGAFTAEATAFLKKIPRDRIIDKPFELKTIRDILQSRVQPKKAAG